jgi:hypothetical protein
MNIKHIFGASKKTSFCHFFFEKDTSLSFFLSDKKACQKSRYRTFNKMLMSSKQVGRSTILSSTIQIDLVRLVSD